MLKPSPLHTKTDKKKKKKTPIRVWTLDILYFLSYRSTYLTGIINWNNQFCGGDSCCMKLDYDHSVLNTEPQSSVQSQMWHCRSQAADRFCMDNLENRLLMQKNKWVALINDIQIYKNMRTTLCWRKDHILNSMA